MSFNKKNLLQFLLAVIASSCALPQFGGGSAGGLIGHHQPLDHYVIGLSGGIEEHEGEEDQGHQEQHGHYEHHDQHEHHEEKHKEHSIGFTGSDFKTPVDVHHEKEIHIKVTFCIKYAINFFRFYIYIWVFNQKISS